MLPELVVPTLLAYFNHNGKIFGMIDNLLYIVFLKKAEWAGLY